VLLRINSWLKAKLRELQVEVPPLSYFGQTSSQSQTPSVQATTSMGSAPVDHVSHLSRSIPPVDDIVLNTHIIAIPFTAV
jgi:hypothetical protein